MKRLNLSIPALPVGQHKATTVVRANSASGTVFVKLSDGKVFIASGRATMSLDREWRCSDIDRRAYASLAGISMADIKGQMQIDKKRRAARAKKDDIDIMRKRAQRAGYKLVRVAK